jgi:hypothetical protein
LLPAADWAADVACECATLPALLPAADVMREFAMDGWRLALLDVVVLPCLELTGTRTQNKDKKERKTSR